MNIPVALLPKVRSEDLMRACGSMPCALRIASFAGLPCAAQGTVVGCHLPVTGKGVATKVTDLAVAAGCMTCHDMLDGRDPRGALVRDRYPADYARRLLNALVETQARWIGMGLINGTDWEII